MDEITSIIEKYDEDYRRHGTSTIETIYDFSLTFYTDVAEIYDILTRIRNIKRNPTGFDLDDAPILGLLVRIWKLMKEMVSFYKRNNAEFISIFERPLLEASITATYLLSHDSEVIEDYRKCSYKDRLRTLRDAENGSGFYRTKAGKRLYASVKEKMSLEGFTLGDFQQQKKNRWRLQGKNFYDIFAEVAEENHYPYTYGMMSESIHGSWNESMDWCLSTNHDGTFSAYPFHHPADIRYITPLLIHTTKPYELWLMRIQSFDNRFKSLFQWIDAVNSELYIRFDKLFDGP